MRSIKPVVFVASLAIFSMAHAGDPVAWMTMGYSRFVLSPGLEASYHFYPRLGINLGAGFYLQDPDYERLINVTHDYRGGFYYANVGYSGYIVSSEHHSAGLIAGFRLWYGPDYRKLRYYKDGGYHIYFDASTLRPDYGLDLGLFYIWKDYSLLAKWDLARKRFRVGIGYRFGAGRDQAPGDDQPVK